MQSYILGTTQGEMIFRFGLATDVPAPGDYDGDERADAAVYRDGVWYVNGSTSGVFVTQFAVTDDVPVPGVYVQYKALKCCKNKGRAMKNVFHRPSLLAFTGLPIFALIYNLIALNAHYRIA